MLLATSKAPALLADRAGQVAEFVWSCLNDDGGFRGRDGPSDLYYTVFGLGCLSALGAKLPQREVAEFLRGFAAGEELDFVHLTCLARCWASLSQPAERDVRDGIAAGIERHRSADGGYSQAVAGANGTAYGCFLALGAYQDLGAELPEPAGLIRCIRGLSTLDGGFGNDPQMETGTTPATAAGVCVLDQLGCTVRQDAAEWLVARSCRRGGFLAMPAAPIPDLLSTATALHGLVSLGCRPARLKRPCLEFLDSLWAKAGAFRGNWFDHELDCEYAFYGLLALGHLSDWPDGH